MNSLIATMESRPLTLHAVGLEVDVDLFMEKNLLNLKGSATTLRSLFLMALALFFSLGRCSSVYAGSTPVNVTIQQSASKIPLNSTFNGFSFETSTLCGPYLSGGDAPLVALFRQLGPGVVRVGGNSADQVIWDPNGPGLVPQRISPPDLQRLAAFLKATDWKIIYSINFARNTPARAGEEAKYVARILGDRLFGIEIGNEPGAYSKNGLRPNVYNFMSFAAEWSAFAGAIKPAIQSASPSAVLVGPADTDFTPQFITAFGSEVGLITEHYHHGSGQAEDIVPKLLAFDPYLTNNILPNLYRLTKAVPVPFRLGETNAFFQPIKQEMNPFATALWAIDFEFINALGHSTGVNFHTVAGLSPIDDHAGRVVRVNPIFYAMKLFSMAAKGDLLATAVSAQQATLSAYAVAGHDGSTYVVLNNKDPNNSVEASIEFTQPVSSATAMFLTAPSLRSATGISLGGESIGADGNWTGGQSTPLLVNGAIGRLAVPPGSAALIRTAPSVAAFSSAATQPVALATGVSLVKNGMCMDVAQGSRSVGPYIQQHACNGTPNQSFVFASTTDSYYTIRSENNQLCLQAPPDSSSVIQNNCTAGKAQRWQLKRSSDGTYSLATSDGSGCLGIPNAPTASGSLFAVSPCGTDPGQKLKFTNTPDILVPLRRQ
jgi:hypothetical protein